jgi:hypothetical protein
LRCFNWYVNDRFNNFNIGEDQGNYPTDTIVFFGCIEYRPPNRQCFGTDMRCYIYVLLKFTVPTKCWLLEQVTSAQTERAAEHIPMLTKDVFDLQGELHSPNTLSNIVYDSVFRIELASSPSRRLPLSTTCESINLSETTRVYHQ